MSQPIREFFCGYPGCRCLDAATALGSQEVTTAFPSAPSPQPPSPRPNSAYLSPSFGSFMDRPKPVSVFPPAPTLPPLYQSLYPTDLSLREIQDRMRCRQEHEAELQEARRGKAKADDTLPAVGSSSSVCVAPPSSAAPAAIRTLSTPSNAWLHDYQMQVKLFEERSKAALLSNRLTKLEAEEKARVIPSPPTTTPISAAPSSLEPQPSERKPGYHLLQDYKLDLLHFEQQNKQRLRGDDRQKIPLSSALVPTSAPMPQPSEQKPREWTWDYESELKHFEQQDEQNRQKILAAQWANLQAATSNDLLAHQFNSQDTRQSTRQNPHQANTPYPLRAQQDAISAAIRTANRPEPPRVQAVPTPEPTASTASPQPLTPPPSARRASTPIPPRSPSQEHRRPSNARNEYSPAALRLPPPLSGPSGPARQTSSTPPAPAPTQTTAPPTSAAQTKQQRAWLQPRHAEVMQHFNELRQFVSPPRASSPLLAAPERAAADADALPRVPRFSLAGSETHSGEDADIDEDAVRHVVLVQRSFAGDTADAEENQGPGDGWTRVVPELDFVGGDITEGEEECVAESEEDGWWIV